MSSSIGPKIELQGEKEYRKALTDINKEMKVLTSEMKVTSAQFDGNANSMDALTKKSDILNKEYDEQTKKVKTLQGALDKSKELYGDNANQVKDWQIKLNNAEAELSKLDKELKTNDKYLDEAKKSTDGTAKSIDEFGKEVKGAGDETLKTGDIIKANLTSEAIIQGVKALGGAMKDAAKGAVDLTVDAAAYADDILTMSTQTGIATDKLQAYKYMAELTDVSLDDMTKTMTKNVKSMYAAQTGSKNFKDAYSKLNVEFEDADGNLRNNEEVYWELIEALGEMENKTEADALAMQVFGKSARDLNPVIDIGKEGIAKFTKEAEAMGAILDEDALDALGETDDAFQRLDQTVKIAKRTIGAEMAPAMADAAETITAKVSEMDGELAKMAGGALNLAVDGFSWMIDNADLIASGVAGIGAAMLTNAAVSGVTSAVGAFKSLSESLKLAKTAQEGFNLAQNASTIGLAVTAVAGLTTALVVYARTQDKTSEEFDKLKSQIDDVVDSSNELTTAVENSKEQFEKSTDEIEVNSEANKNLVDNLYELADKENKSNAEKAKMQSMVNQLNESMPDLNLVMDEQTGILSKQKDEVYNLIESLREKALAQAYEERYLELTKEQIRLEDERKKASDATREAREALTNAEKEATEVNVNNQNEVKQSRATVQEYEEQLKTAKGELDSLSLGLVKNAKSLKETEDRLGDTTAATDEYADSTTQANEEVIKALEDAKTAYEEAREAAINSIQSQIDIFDKFAEKSEVTKEELLKNLDSQVVGITSWADNLESLSKKGIDDGLLKHLKEMGPSAAQEIAALNSMTEEELKIYSGKWSDLGEATERAAEITVSDTKDIYSKAYMEEQAAALKAGEKQMTNHNKGVQNKSSDANKTALKVVNGAISYADTNSASKAKKAGGNVVSGIGQGIDDEKSKLYAKAMDLGNKLFEKFNSSIDAHSPSRKFKLSGGYIADGVIEGMDGKKKDLDKAAGDMGELLIESTNKKLDRFKLNSEIGIEFATSMGGIQKEMANTIPSDLTSSTSINSSTESNGSFVRMVDDMITSKLSNLNFKASVVTPLIVGTRELGNAVIECQLENDRIDNATPQFG